MSWYTWAWIGFGLYFAVVETLALIRSQRGDTLSEHLWWIFGTARGIRPTVGAWVRRGILVLALGVAGGSPAVGWPAGVRPPRGAWRW